MADEKTNPTPKVAARDTMHSTPGTPDRSQLSPEELAAERTRTAPPSNTGSVGSERPGRQVIGSSKPNDGNDQPAGTLVTDIPPLDEGEPQESVVPNPAPEEPLALQPGEPLDTNTRLTGDARAKSAAKAQAALTSGKSPNSTSTKRSGSSKTTSRSSSKRAGSASTTVKAGGSKGEQA